MKNAVFFPEHGILLWELVLYFILLSGMKYEMEEKYDYKMDSVELKLRMWQFMWGGRDNGGCVRWGSGNEVATPEQSYNHLVNSRLNFLRGWLTRIFLEKESFELVWTGIYNINLKSGRSGEKRRREEFRVPQWIALETKAQKLPGCLASLSLFPICASLLMGIPFHWCLRDHSQRHAIE
jgi:hypothetical protein